MFLTCVLEIPNPLSLYVKLSHCNLKKKRVSKVSFFLLAQQKNENYYKFVNMIAMAFPDLLVSTFKNCSKFCSRLNPLSIK